MQFAAVCHVHHLLEMPTFMITLKEREMLLNDLCIVSLDSIKKCKRLKLKRNMKTKSTSGHLQKIHSEKSQYRHHLRKRVVKPNH